MRIEGDGRERKGRGDIGKGHKRVRVNGNMSGRGPGGKKLT